MKLSTLGFNSILAMGAAALVGCSSFSKKNEAAAAPPTPAQQVVSQLDADRNAYVQATQARIDTMTQTANNLRAHAANVPKPQSKKAENAADDMDSLLKDAVKELADVKSAAPENWVDEKRDVEKVMSRAETQYSNSVTLLK